MSGTLPPSWDCVPIPLRATFYLSRLWGAGLRRMYLEDAEEYVSVVGTDAFMEFVESIQAEGVELERRPMGAEAKPNTSLVIEVDTENRGKDIDTLDIEIPTLTRRVYREYRNLEGLGPYTARFYTCPLSAF